MTSNSEIPEISVLVSCYFEEASLDEFYSRLSKTMKSLGRPYEIIIVNDGSTDGTWEKIQSIFAGDPHVTTIIDFFRNAGQAAAKTAAFEHARGSMLLFLDSDLQLDPEEIPLLVDEFDKGCDIVSGYRRKRQDSLLRSIPSLFANMIMRKVSGHPLTDFGCTFKIYDARLIRAFQFNAFKPWRPAYVFARAQRCREVPVSHHPRKYGVSGWKFKNLMAYQMDYLVGMSQRPFQLLSLLCLFIAGLLLLRILLAWVFPVSILSRVTRGLILNAILLHLMITLAVLSAIGEYVIRNFISLQRYPVYVIREIQKKDALASVSQDVSERSTPPDSS